MAPLAVDESTTVLNLIHRLDSRLISSSENEIMEFILLSHRIQSVRNHYETKRLKYYFTSAQISV